MTTTELKEKIISIFEEDTDTFCNVCEAIDDEVGLLYDYRCYPMWDLNELLYGKSAEDIIDLILDNDDFDKHDDYFYWDWEGLHTTEDRLDIYTDITDFEEVANILIEEVIDIEYCGNDELAEVIDDYKETHLLF